MREARNDGSITATSSQFGAVGMYAANGGYLVNTAAIEATRPLGAYGVALSTHVANVVNLGTISADVAVQTNVNVNGGSVALGGRRDIYSSAGGVQIVLGIGRGRQRPVDRRFGSRTDVLVPPTGLEPVTPALRMRPFARYSAAFRRHVASM